MKVLHNVYTLGRSASGVGEAVRALSRAQARRMPVGIVLQDRPEATFPLEEAAGIQLHRLPPHRLARFGFHPRFLSDSRLRGYDIVHQHSSWTAHSILSILLSYSGARIVYTPHSALDPGLSGNGSFRKAVAWAVYERWVLRRAAAIHALSPRELADVRARGIRTPIAVIPNGVDDDVLDRPARPGHLRARLGLPEGRKVLLFMSRVHPVKGIDGLISQLAGQPDFRASWVLVVAGPGTPAFRAHLDALVQRHGLGDLIFFSEPLYDHDTLDAYDDCDGFVLPSLIEGMPLAVLKAMARRRAVLTTVATPIEEIDTERAGLRSGLSVAEREQALAAFLALDDEELAAMGERGHAAVARTYRWSQVSEMVQALYTWLCMPGTPPPPFVSFAPRPGHRRK
ncbi:glycosyltransferase [Deinococcus sp.]|uniref:glycosyltransferase n=1 Tax=Deinococcus sp. TaxID=47478 RepID=UPI0028698F73|nr:glycosyltransferase [Deinococcus sp.]